LRRHFSSPIESLVGRASSRESDRRRTVLELIDDVVYSPGSIDTENQCENTCVTPQLISRLDGQRHFVCAVAIVNRFNLDREEI